MDCAISSADGFSIKLLLSMLFTLKSVLVDAVGRCHDHELGKLVQSTAHAQADCACADRLSENLLLSELVTP